MNRKPVVPAQDAHKGLSYDGPVSLRALRVFAVYLDVAAEKFSFLLDMYAQPMITRAAAHSTR